MKGILKKVLGRRKVTVLAVVVALTVGTASTALAGSGVGGVFNLGVTNTVNAITDLVGSVAGPMLRIDNNSTGTGATALALFVEPGKAPMTVNSKTKVANLNADSVDGKSAEQLSRVAQMQTSATTLIPNDFTQVTYGSPLSITAPAAGFVRINGNVTVLNNTCTADCAAVGRVRHVQTGTQSLYSESDVNTRRGNIGLDNVFPVSAGVNTFDIQLNKLSGTGDLYGWWGTLTAEYTPYGSTGTGALDFESGNPPTDKKEP